MVKQAESIATAAEMDAAGKAAESEKGAVGKTPDQIVEEKILARLEKEKLLDAQGLKAVRDKLGAGLLAEGDWKLSFENVLERRKRNG
jgi:hypothetical protein